jgi:type II secretory pathway component PulC
MNIPSFDFELIGFRSGDVDSSVILKKGNKEFVIAKGEKIDGVYELIEVNKEEVIFRNNEKLYKIKNRLGK